MVSGGGDARECPQAEHYKKRRVNLASSLCYEKNASHFLDVAAEGTIDLYEVRLSVLRWNNGRIPITHPRFQASGSSC